MPSSIVSWRIILAVCRRVRSSFLPVFSVSPELSYPTLSLSLFVYHFIIIILAVAVFGVEQFDVMLWLASFSRLGSYVLYWNITSDSQSSYSGRDTLLYSSVGDFWVENPARSGCLFAVELLGSIPRGRSHSFSEFRWGCLFAFIFVGQRCFQLRVQSAKWADSARAPSQVNGRSSPHYDSRSFSQSRRICIPRRLLIWRQYHWVDEHQKQKLNHHFKVAGHETWFPASLTGKVR